ncbi:FtsW/RodA/SpoVE family cell cycle protein [Clostridium fallax]|uniref:Cell division protein FtsW, lipid II flippase n=1 Tax=Clostridium fallax TaxID=1533 RepID=A0A1M4VM12_9CLOT|nr:FtsW/RodA/SpoVE family cell cycle protein [Clostridium fallax]SHE69830.1 cell division protein FtsW, lipid II flippase [Clostridium fallax]SQB22782.1 FtsW/RodA/SpoVE family cell cycle protein [Clostridium fallax]
MSSLKYERRLLLMTYLLCAGLFINLALLKNPVDKTALLMGTISIVIIALAHFIVRKFFPDGDKFLLVFASVLAVIGLAVIYRLDSKLAIKQLIWFVAGMTCYVLIVVLLPNLRSFAKYKYLYLTAIAIFMPMALLIGQARNGSKNWVVIGGFSFQPSEIGKIFLVLYLASALANYEDKKNLKEDFKQLLEPALVVMGALGCMVLQRDLGSALIFFGISVTMLYIATSKMKYVITCLGLFVVGAFFSYNLFSHVRKRVLIWKDVWKYANNESYQIVQGLYAMSSGGILGSGLGQGYPGFIPFNYNDFIFAAICEELGLVFGIGVMLVYFLLFYRGMRAALNTSSKFSQLNAVGFSAMIAMQVLVIIGGIFAVIPLTGIALPLVSYGGTSMLTMFFALGILQKISEEG